MTTTVFLIRHVPHALQDKVQVGRMDDIDLARDAPERLARVSAVLKNERLDAVYASPFSRAQATAQAVAEPHGLAVRTDPDLIELDFGDWTGRRFDELDSEPAYAAWNSARGLARVPGGESMWECQARMLSALERVRGAHPHGRVALVSHGDPLKSLLLHILGLPLDAYGRIDLDPGSASAASVGDWGARVHSLNRT